MSHGGHPATQPLTLTRAAAVITSTAAASRCATTSLHSTPSVISSVLLLRPPAPTPLAGAPCTSDLC